VSCTENKDDGELRKKANDLAQKFIVADTHVDLPYRLRIKHFRLEREYLGIPVSTPEGDFDYERAKKGGLDAPFMSIYIPSEYQLKTDMGKVLADSLIDLIHGIVEAHPGQICFGRYAARS
jgi:membrane dipeptidase